MNQIHDNKCAKKDATVTRRPTSRGKVYLRSSSGNTTRNSKRAFMEVKNENSDFNSDYDTDLEEFDDRENSPEVYEKVCNSENVVPCTEFWRQIGANTEDLYLDHYCFNLKGVKAIAIALVKNANVRTLSLKDNSLCSQGCLYLADMLLDNVSITSLDLTDNKIGTEGCRAICNMLQQNRLLTSVDISGNQLIDNDAEFIAEVFMSEKVVQLRRFGCGHNNFSEKGGKIIGRSIGQNIYLNSLDLSWNHLRREGAVAICQGLMANSCITEINLAWNGFGDEGAAAMSGVFKSNTTLVSVDLSNNRITSGGAMLIGKGLLENETLVSLMLGGNHLMHAGAIAILECVDKNETSRIRHLDFSGISVNHNFVMLYKDLKFERCLEVIYDRVNTRRDIIQTVEEKLDPKLVLRDFIMENKLRVTDLFNRLDRDKDRRISKKDFRESIQELKFPIPDDERRELFSKIDTKSKSYIDMRDLSDFLQPAIGEERRNRWRRASRVSISGGNSKDTSSPNSDRRRSEIYSAGRLSETYNVRTASTMTQYSSASRSPSSISLTNKK